VDAAGDALGFFDVLQGQRACRAFGSDPVDDALVARVLEAATWAPSAENRQPWVFVVVRDPDKRAAIGDLMRRAWEGGARTFSEPRLAPGLLADVDRGARGGVAGAPVLVVVCADTTLCHPATVGASIFPAVQNLLLAATALGLGSVLTTLAMASAPGPAGEEGRKGGLKGAELASLVGLPSTVVPVAVVPLGWPERRLGPARRRPMSDVTHRDTYGAGW
jgi:nitroreductase